MHARDKLCLYTAVLSNCELQACRLEARCTGSDTVDATSEFCTVVRLRLGDHEILMGAEIDAQEISKEAPAETNDLDTYVEIKSYK